MNTPTPIEHSISALDENWQALPERLRGRGDWLRERGRIKDAELMFDAATEIQGLRSQAAGLLKARKE